MTHTARIIDGKRIAAAVREEVRERVRRLRETHAGAPGLAVILVGDDAASATYVRSKTRACEEAGIASRQVNFPRYISQDELTSAIQSLNRDSGIHGILIQLPLPAHLDERAALEVVDPGKDVDGFTYREHRSPGGESGAVRPLHARRHPGASGSGEDRDRGHARRGGRAERDRGEARRRCCCFTGTPP